MAENDSHHLPSLAYDAGPFRYDPELLLKHASPISPMGRVFATVAFVEALTWAGLLIGMYFKYQAADPTPVGVKIFGPVHGVAFMVYVVVSVLAAIRLRWPWWAALLALAAAVPPLVTLPLEWWFKRCGLLSAPIARTR